MGQKLILPINNCKLGVGFKSMGYRAYIQYRKSFWTVHRGVDLKGHSTVWASGNGTVIEAGWDDDFGNVVIVKYSSCEYQNIYGDIKSRDLIIRYFHMASYKVSKGQSVTKDTQLGTIGTTGIREYTGVSHVSIEIDTDTAYPAYSPSKPSGSAATQIIKAGTYDTVINPAYVFHCKISSPDNQSYNGDGDSVWVHPTTGSKSEWYLPYDLDIPPIK